MSGFIPRYIIAVAENMRLLTYSVIGPRPVLSQHWLKPIFLSLEQRVHTGVRKNLEIRFYVLPSDARFSPVCTAKGWKSWCQNRVQNGGFSLRCAVDVQNRAGEIPFIAQQLCCCFILDISISYIHTRNFHQFYRKQIQEKKKWKPQSDKDSTL